VSQESPPKSALRAALPAIALALFALAPFLTKAFTIDDTLFLLQARHLLVDPLHPTAFDGVFSMASERMSNVTASGPAMPYLLVPCLALGGAEWAAHLVQIFLLALGLVATAALSLRFGLRFETSRAATLLVATCPAVLGMAGTAMPDVPAMAFGVLGVERAVAWARDKRAHQAVTASFALALAALCRSHLVLLLGVAALACVGEFLRPNAWARLRWMDWFPLLACPVLIASALVLTSDPKSAATAIVGASHRFVHLDAVPGNFIAYLAHWVVAIPLALPWAALHPRRIFVRPVLYAATVLAWLYLRTTPIGMPFLAAAVAGLGAAVIADLMDDARRRRDGVQLLMGVWILVPIVVVPYLHLPSKYLLAAAPAAAIAVARAAGNVSRVRARAVCGLASAFGFTLGILILRADADLAGLGRKAAKELIPASGASEPAVWFDGHWGFYWYAERAGARPLSIEPPYPQAGDLVVASQLTGLGFLEEFPRRRLLGVVTEAGPGGRVMSRSAGAGFYSNDFGIWPWGWGREPADRYELWALESSD